MLDRSTPAGWRDHRLAIGDGVYGLRAARIGACASAMMCSSWVNGVGPAAAEEGEFRCPLWSGLFTQPVLHKEDN